MAEMTCKSSVEEVNIAEQNPILSNSASISDSPHKAGDDAETNSRGQLIAPNCELVTDEFSNDSNLHFQGSDEAKFGKIEIDYYSISLESTEIDENFVSDAIVSKSKKIEDIRSEAPEGTIPVNIGEGNSSPAQATGSDNSSVANWTIIDLEDVAPPSYESLCFYSDSAAPIHSCPRVTFSISSTEEAVARILLNDRDAICSVGDAHLMSSPTSCFDTLLTTEACSERLERSLLVVLGIAAALSFAMVVYHFRILLGILG